MSLNQQLKQVLTAVDDQRRGSLSHEQLKTGLRMAGMSVTPAEFEKLIAKSDPERTGHVQINTFVETVTDKPRSPKIPLSGVRTPVSAMKSPQPLRPEDIPDFQPPERNKSSYNIIANREWVGHDPSMSAADYALQTKVIEKVRDSIQIKSKHLRKTFRQLDLNHDGVLSFPELRSGLDAMGINLKDDEFSRIARLFDRSGTGEIDYDEFADIVMGDTLAGSLPERRQKRATNTFVSSLGNVNPITNEGAEAEPQLDPSLARRKSLSFQSSQGDYDIIRHQKKEAEGTTPTRPMPSLSQKQLREDRKIIDKIRDKVVGKSKRFAKVFRSFDDNHDGVVSYDEFRNGLQHLGAPLSDTEFEKLLKRCDPDGTGEIDYDSFAAVILPSDFGAQRAVRSGRRGRKATAEYKHNSATLQAIQDKLAAKSEHLAKVFRQFDMDHDGTVSHAELREGLKQLNFELNDQDFEALVNVVDADRNGYVDYNEFARSLKQQEDGAMTAVESEDPFVKQFKLNTQVLGVSTSLSPAPKVAKAPVSAEHDRSLIKRVADVMHGRGEQMIRAFRNLDRDFDGKVAYSELKRALADTRIVFSDPDFQRFVTLVDRNGDGYVDYHEFADVFASGDIDQQLEQLQFMQRGAKLDVAEKQHQVEQQKMLRNVRDKISGKSATLRKVFRDFDEDHNGTISRTELRAGLTALGVPLSDPEFDSLVHVVDADDSGSIDYDEFAKVFNAVDTPVMTDAERDRIFDEYRKRARTFSVAGNGGAMETTKQSGRRTRKAQQDAIDADIVKKVAEATMRNPNQIRAAFKRLDRDYDGKISYAEFRRGLCNMKVGISEAELQRLILKCDADGDGYIDFNEFVSVFGGASDPSATSVLPVPEAIKKRQEIAADPTLQEARAKIASKAAQLKKVFRAFDEDHDGTLSTTELRKGLGALGVTLGDEEFDRLISVVDTNKGNIDYHEFARVFKESDEDNSLLMSQHEDPRLKEFANSQRTRRHTLDMTSLQMGAAKPRSDNPFQAFVDEKIVSRVMNAVQDHPQQLRKAFHRLDTDLDGRVTYQEFKRGLCDMKIDVSEADMQRLITQCDHNQEGVIDYNAFCGLFGAEERTQVQRLPATSTAMHNSDRFEAHHAFDFDEQGALENKIRLTVGGKLSSFKKTLNDLDCSSSGTLTHQELKRGLTKFGVILNGPQFIELVKKADPQNAGYVNVNDFAQFFGAQVVSSPQPRQTLTPGRRILHLRTGPPEARTRQFRQTSMVAASLGLLDARRQVAEMEQRRLSM
eukprot:TRINITY_DN212_c1_g1_i1.p1 TRINITY_DN212_c1_g1~~TRINITY_DN212_c1_g1_i1.p1  ORF type:complete len:1273 (+),score=360.04 TRINITY_DN212_c1_g1_i1:159-3977(+)